ncbi:MAG TPA: NHL repeat-containing protein [Opitutaceae bacterium]|nr:NHL repeat-containing protein [Opitutaceae bacterium]
MRLSFAKLLIVVAIAGAAPLTPGHTVYGPWTGRALPRAADGNGNAATFGGVADLAVDPLGYVYVADLAGMAVRKIAPDRTVTTLAAGVNQPNCIAVEPDGTLYIGSRIGGLIYKMSPTGALTTFATGVHPEGIVVASDHMLYCTESMFAPRVIKITPSGEVTTIAGGTGPGDADGTGGAAKFDFPGAIACGPDGNLYVTDGNIGVVRKVTPEGVVTTVLKVGSGVYGVCFDSTGAMYVSSWGSGQVYNVTKGGRINVYAGGGSGFSDGYVAWCPLAGVDPVANQACFELCGRIGADRAGNVFVGDFGVQNVRKISPFGVVTTYAGPSADQLSADGPATTAHFAEPQSIAFDKGDNLFVADAGSHTIRKVSPDGVVTTIAGTPGRPRMSDASPGRLYTPYAIAVAPNGAVYVGEWYSNAIRIIQPSGDLSLFTVINDGGGVSGLAFDDAGNLYALDAISSVVHKITAAGSASVLAGTPNLSGFADGSGAAARFCHPSNGIAVDHAGNVYVSDTGNGAIRKVTPDGTVSTIADGAKGAAGLIDIPLGLTIGPDGAVYLASMRSVRKITPAGVVTTLPGFPLPTGVPAIDNYGSPGSAGTITGIAFNSRGTLYLAELYTDRIFRATDAAKLVNLSARATTGFGDNALIAGFVANGNKSVLVRAIGPSLATYGVNHVEHDPNLTLRDAAGTITSSNEDWGGTTHLADTFTSVGAFALSPTSRDAALVTEVGAAGYTAQVQGSENGIALVELYDASATSPSQLINLSARNYVGSGEAALFAGFSIKGDAPKRLLIRGIGPTLAQYGVSGALKATKLTIADQTSGALIQSVDGGWYNDKSLLVPLFNQVGAFALPDYSQDSATVLVLNPGAYTVQLSAPDGPGIGLIEIYDLDL